MQNTPIWKPVLIVVVLGLAALSLYPPSQRLKPGLDLAGGTTLIYQVDVGDVHGQDTKTVIDQTIASLRKRVDPNGVRNLIWRRQAGNRIEIQVPLPPKETGVRRARYLELRDQLVSRNIQPRDLSSAMRADADHRPAALARIADGDEARLARLQSLAEVYDALTTARKPYSETQTLQREAERTLRDLPVDTPTEQIEAATVRLTELTRDLTTKTRAYLAAQKQYDAAEANLLATNIDPAYLEQALNLPDTASSNNKTATRTAALDELKTANPGLAGQIDQVAQAHALYQELRGPLDDPNDLIALLRGSGVLEFRIGLPAKDIPDVTAYIDQLQQRGPKAGTGKPYRWFVVDDVTSFADTAEEREHVEADPADFFNKARGLVGRRHAGEYYLLLGNSLEESMTDAHEGWKLSNAFPTSSEGYPVVGFQLNRIGGELMGAMTGAYTKRPMAIVLDGRVISTPTIQSQIHDSGIISGGGGGFSQDEMSYLIRTLNAGTLQGRLSQDPISIKKFGPQLGQDNLDSGLKAAVWALAAVACLMAFYYLFLGVVADFALAANMVIILGVMAMFDATFTLPGIAGIVLTIGMAVDANVLIFERIGEELARKADIRTAVRLGYDKALSTIIDANLTTLITCVILKYTATAEIKGFAVTLMIGILATMFTALFCTRVIVTAYLGLTGARTLRMLPAISPALGRLLNPSVNWVGKRHALFVVSAILMITGATAVWSRGVDLLDIEFRSGTQVGFELAADNTLTLEQARARLTTAADNSALPGLRGDRAVVVTVGDVNGDQANAFSVATLETDSAAVGTAIKAAFADVLDTERPIDFAGMGRGSSAPPVREAAVYPVRSNELGANINRPDVDTDVTDFLGGVAVVLTKLDPPPTAEQLTQRIQRMRLQPAYENLGFRPSTIVGLDLAPGTSAGGEPRYRSAAVVTSDEVTNYIENPDEFTIANGLAATEWQLVHDALRRDTSLSSVSNFSSQVSNTMKQQAIVALVLSLLAVVIYIWVRFGSLRYGLAAIAALVHDVTITLGLVAIAGWAFDSALGHVLLLSDFKINLALVAALLTIVGYSLNDTIVVFDRVRENRGRLATASAGVINDSINQTISRTVMTSVSTLLALCTLYLFGGDGVHGFAFAMLIGVLVGTYSSIAIAAPLLMIGGGPKSEPSDTSDDSSALVPTT